MDRFVNGLSRQTGVPCACVAVVGYRLVVVRFLAPEIVVAPYVDTDTSIGAGDPVATATGTLEAGLVCPAKRVATRLSILDVVILAPSIDQHLLSARIIVEAVGCVTLGLNLGVDSAGLIVHTTEVGDAGVVSASSNTVGVVSFVTFANVSLILGHTSRLVSDLALIGHAGIVSAAALAVGMVSQVAVTQLALTPGVTQVAGALDLTVADCTVTDPITAALLTDLIHCAVHPLEMVAEVTRAGDLAVLLVTDRLVRCFAGIRQAQVRRASAFSIGVVAQC